MFSPRLREKFLARKEFIDEVCLSLARYLGSDSRILCMGNPFVYP